MAHSWYKTDPEAFAAGRGDFQKVRGFAPKSHKMIRDSGDRFGRMMTSYRMGYDSAEAEAIQRHEDSLKWSVGSLWNTQVCD